MTRKLVVLQELTTSCGESFPLAKMIR